MKIKIILPVVFSFRQLLQQRVDGLLVHPVILSEEDHRACDAGRLVVVLRGVLEDLLDGTGAAGSEEDARLGDFEQAVLPHAVGEFNLYRNGPQSSETRDPCLSPFLTCNPAAQSGKVDSSCC